MKRPCSSCVCPENNAKMNSVMKTFAVKRYGTIDNVEPVELERPAVGSDEVLIRVKAAALNPADLKVITGKNGGRWIHSGRSPIALGFDYSGVIREIGAGAAGCDIGDEIFGFLPYSRQTAQGSFAEYLVVQNGTFAEKPPSVSHTAAACAATTASTALQSLVDIGSIRQGQKILVNGASGGVGSYAVQIAKSFGTEVWGISSAKNLEFIKSIGVDQAVDYQENSLSDLSEKFDIILDAASNASFSECSAILASKGIYITLLPSLSLITGKIRSIFSSRKCAVCIVQPREADLAQIAGLLEKKTITAPVAATYPVAELKNALRQFKAGGVRGKIGIEVDRSP